MAQQSRAPVGAPEPMDPVDHLHHRGEPSPRWRSGSVTIETLDCVPDWDTVRIAVERTTRMVPRLRQKVVSPLLPTTAPRWVVDNHFDLDYHLRRVHLPSPGSMRELLDLAEVAIQSSFDPARPLWTMTLVEGLQGDKAALVLHNSHAVTDGVVGLLILQELYDDQRETTPREMPDAPVAGELGSLVLTRDGLVGMPGAAVSAARSMVGAAGGALHRLTRDPFLVLTSTQKYVRSVKRVAGPSSIPPSPALAHRSLRSRSSCVDVEIADLRAAAKRSGTTLNDAYLATLCAALRLYHQAARRPVETLPMVVPFTMRTVTDPSEYGHISGITIAAPIAVDDPGERMKLIHRQVAAGRVEPALGVLDTMAPWMTPLPDPVLEAVSEMRPVADIQARNIRGYRTEKFIAGARVERAYGLCPKHRVAIMAALASRAGRGSITTRYDTASVIHTDLWEQALAQAVAETVGYARNETLVENVVLTTVSKPRPRRVSRRGSRAATAAPAAGAATEPPEQPGEPAPTEQALELSEQPPEPADQAPMHQAIEPTPTSPEQAQPSAEA